MDHFETLGLNINCNNKDVKEAYLNLARRWHPDNNKSPQASQRFMMINSAYEALKDEDKRRELLSDIELKKYQRQQQKHRTDYKAHSNYSKSTFKVMQNFESILHPRFLFIYLPLVFGTSWFFHSYFKRDSSASDINRRLKMANENDTKIAAWYNPKSKRWETPAPWDSTYQQEMQNKNLEQVARSLVHQSILPIKK